MLLWIIALLLLVIVLASETARGILFLIAGGALAIGFCLFVLAAIGIALIAIFN